MPRLSSILALEYDALLVASVTQHIKVHARLVTQNPAPVRSGAGFSEARVVNSTGRVSIQSSAAAPAIARVPAASELKYPDVGACGFPPSGSKSATIGAKAPIDVNATATPPHKLACGSALIRNGNAQPLSAKSATSAISALPPPPKRSL